ncbi:bZIP transcription factor [Aspergillus mulundensis]|uniref:BZIP domain-containing protein n=1 Tax=Aspergillus mulundensis TaxID=1810919 RepID=A0A3D8RQX9_9EURO|nr:Uncharacterized protein DSM5745_06475 [Aspergillus mulundensis]RDW76483.1 Uncharacterized protein DSM5745_06475 [Aspergillus mulundensis]
MNSAAKEKKRAADRETQRHNRARTKAYIASLEKTIQDLAASNGDASLGHQLAQQQEQINHLQQTLRKIVNLAQDGAGSLPPSAIPERSSQHTRDATSQPTCEEGTPAASAIMDAPPGANNNNGFFGIDLSCLDRERNYLAVLGNALSLAQYFASEVSGGNNDNNNHTLTPVSDDDDFCIRAVVDGWKAATARFEADVVWSLLRTLDEGLYCTRTDPVTRIGLLRIMRSMLLHRIGVAREVPPLPDYMLTTPQFRDHWIFNGTEYVDEKCAALFSTRIWFEWPFELRDVYHKQVMTDTLSFSAEFERRYHDLNSWHLNSGTEWLEWSLEACQMRLEELQPPALK